MPGRHSEGLVRTRHFMLGLQTLPIWEHRHRHHPAGCHHLFAGLMQGADWRGGGFGMAPAKCELRSLLGLVVSGNTKLRAMFRGQVL